jgi:hypothetical protein
MEGPVTPEQERERWYGDRVFGSAYFPDTMFGQQLLWQVKHGTVTSHVRDLGLFFWWESLDWSWARRQPGVWFEVGLA